MAFQKFSELYDKTNYIDSCRFWMMLKMKFKSEHWDKRYEMFLLDFKKYLLTLNHNINTVCNEIKSVQLSAYRTIPQSFF
jgi:hypothetical protein